MDDICRRDLDIFEVNSNVGEVRLSKSTLELSHLSIESHINTVKEMSVR